MFFCSLSVRDKYPGFCGSKVFLDEHSAIFKNFYLLSSSEGETHGETSKFPSAMVTVLALTKSSAETE